MPPVVTTHATCMLNQREYYIVRLLSPCYHLTIVVRRGPSVRHEESRTFTKVAKSLNTYWVYVLVRAVVCVGRGRECRTTVGYFVVWLDFMPINFIFLYQFLPLNSANDLCV